jgi:hypothetical protein
MKRLGVRSFLCIAVVATGCSGSGGSSGGGDAASSAPADGAAPGTSMDAAARDAAPDTSADAAARDATPPPPADGAPEDAAPPAPNAGFVFGGPRHPAPHGTGASYGALELATHAGPPGATIGAPCRTGDDCASLGPQAACLHSATGGFCTQDCSQDPEGATSCPAGSNCFSGFYASPDGIGARLCLLTCTTQDDCRAAGMQCSGSFFTFNPGPDGSLRQHVCLPSCAADADCNTDASGFLCDPTLHRCEDPDDVLGSACSSDADCLGLGPGGACLRSVREPARSYCTIACDPAAADPCPFDMEGRTAPDRCVSGYAATPDGRDVPVCLRHCASDGECQFGSANTCNYLPALEVSVCTVACATDADCVDGTCNRATGDCQQTALFAPNCASDSNCAGGLCVLDFHVMQRHNCSQRCAADADCPAGAVCVTSPDAWDGTGERLETGFCAPSCTLDGAACPDPTTACHAPTDPPEVDFAASGSASGPFCWR